MGVWSAKTFSLFRKQRKYDDNKVINSVTGLVIGLKSELKREVQDKKAIMNLQEREIDWSRLEMKNRIGESSIFRYVFKVKVGEKDLRFRKGLQSGKEFREQKGQGGEKKDGDIRRQGFYYSFLFL